VVLEPVLESLIKDLYKFYAERHVDQETTGERAVCWGCFAYSEFDGQTGSFPKIKHNDDCEVVVMKKRIKSILES
jgi:hypothetical protein